MNKFTQHIPSFVDTDSEPLTIEFETANELLSNKYFQKYKDPKFSHFAINGKYLMEISDGGFHWWVLGTVENPKELNLPEWEGWKFRALLEGKEVVLSGKEVVSCCGKRLELRDGRVATDLRK